MLHRLKNKSIQPDPGTEKKVKFLLYFIRFTAGLITIFTSKSLRNETISKTKKAIKKNKSRNKPRWTINVYDERLFEGAG
jgi:hypothetical protein